MCPPLRRRRKWGPDRARAPSGEARIPARWQLAAPWRGSTHDGAAFRTPRISEGSPATTAMPHDSATAAASPAKESARAPLSEHRSALRERGRRTHRGAMLEPAPAAFRDPRRTVVTAPTSGVASPEARCGARSADRPRGTRGARPELAPGGGERRSPGFDAGSVGAMAAVDLTSPDAASGVHSLQQLLRGGPRDASRGRRGMGHPVVEHGPARGRGHPHGLARDRMAAEVPALRARARSGRGLRAWRA